MRYFAFLSYSHTDRQWAAWLHRKLEAYRLPKNIVGPGTLRRRLSPIFRDRDELPSAASLSDAVNEALSESEWLIVLCSPASASSRWVNEEIRTFRRLGRSDRILCFVVAGEPSSGGEMECFPPALTELAADGTRIEPIAADARPQGDGKADALLRMIEGMVGVGFDALKQRDQRRRHRRLIAATAASLSIAAVTIALALTATMARNDADRRRAQAENLIDFMLGDLQEQLRQIGRLDLYQGIGNQALKYFASLDDDDVSDYSLAQRAKNLRQIGEVRLEQGELPQALVAFEESLSITAKLAARDPSNAENQIALALSHSYMGLAHWKRGDLAAAQEQFLQSVPIVDAVSAKEPDNPKWLVERGYAYTNLGRVLELEGKLDEALGAYETVLSNNQRLLDLEPENTEWMLELGFAHNNIGKLVTALGRLDEAEQAYRYDLAIKTRVLATNPQHNIWRSYRAVSQFFLGQLLGSRGNYEEAERELSAALDTFEDLSRVDPAQTEWQSRLANTQRELGKVLVQSGRADRGAEYIRSSIGQLNKLSADEADASSRRDLARGLLTLASIEAGRGEVESASERLTSANSQIAMLLQSEPTSRDTRQLAIRAEVCAAVIARGRDPGSAVQAYRRALVGIDRDFPGSSDPEILSLEAKALAGSGRADDAREIESRLAQMGFASVPLL
jgi:tetratricopeptide (TPR) repeat protein